MLVCSVLLLLLLFSSLVISRIKRKRVNLRGVFLSELNYLNALLVLMCCRYTLIKLMTIMLMISVFPHQIALEADELYSGGQSSVGAAALSFNRLHQVRTELVSSLQNTQNHQIMVSDVFKDVSGQTLNPTNHIRSQCHKLCVYVRRSCDFRN